LRISLQDVPPPAAPPVVFKNVRLEAFRLYDSSLALHRGHDHWRRLRVRTWWPLMDPPARCVCARC